MAKRLKQVTISGKCNACGEQVTISGMGEPGSQVLCTGTCPNGHTVQTTAPAGN